MSNKFCPCQTAASVSAALFNLKKAKSHSGPQQTAAASVLSRTVRANNDAYRTEPWLYLVTFRTQDGREPELQTTEAMYKQLKEDTRGQLCWQGDNLVSFTAE